MVRRRFSTIAYLLAVSLCIVFSASLAYSYSGARTTCMRAHPPPTIDGKVSPGEWGEGIYVDKSVTLPGEPNYNGFGNCFEPQHIEDAKDCSGTFYYLWDENYLYLAVKITDDDLYFGGDSIWQNDCTEWRWNPDGKADGPYTGIWITPRFQGDQPGWNVRDFVSGLDETGALPSLKATINPDGYEWELRIPATEPILEELELKAGNVVGFTVSIGENDAEGADYSMPCWSLNPDVWNWDEAFWGEMEFSSIAAVSPNGKLASSWAVIKTR